MTRLVFLAGVLAAAFALLLGYFLGWYDRRVRFFTEPRGDWVTVTASGPDGDIEVRGYIVPSGTNGAWRDLERVDSV